MLIYPGKIMGTIPKLSISVMAYAPKRIVRSDEKRRKPRAYNGAQGRSI
jgi:hypothetical protein